MIRVGIRVDGSETIGMGHIVRCLALAYELREQKMEVTFISKFRKGIDEVLSHGYEVIELEAEDMMEITGVYYGCSTLLKEEANRIRKIIEKEQLDILIIDHYNVNEDFFKKFRNSGVLLVYIDDVYTFDYKVDMIINGNITGKYMGYEKMRNNPKLLLGLEYNMIRREFKNLTPNKKSTTVDEIMITTGGSDTYHLTESFIKWIIKDNRYRNKQLNVIVGAAFESIDKLIELATLNPYVKLYSTSKYYQEQGFPIEQCAMSEVMLKSDVAITTGGSTLYELCACETIPIACIVADNQEFLVEKMHELGYIENLGWYSDITEERLINALEKAELRKKRLEIENHKIVDGNGCSRIATEILEYFKIKNV